ncbi:MAG: DegQ family serine endoprotease [Thermodesulfovibrionia bacterium]|nr:DegQ family serine endoprotease [Thermodesulfovibrionia bacterium]
MKKTILPFLIIIALISGYLIGNRSDFLSNKPSSPPYTYNLELPGDLSGKSAAFSDIVKVISPAVVNISTSKTVIKKDSTLPHFFDGPFKDFFEPFNMPRKWKEQSLGSGVLVSSDGYIITNNHVVEKADEIKVTLYDQQNYKGKIVGTDPKTDIAIIKISTTNLPAIKWGDSDNLHVGEFVLAFGNPYSLGHTVTMGIVSALGRANVGIADYEDFIQTDAAINPGNSGGPLVNIKGELIGINTAIFSRTGGYQGIGFAVPSNMAKSVMNQLIKEGKVTRGWLGVTIQNLTQELAGEFGLDKSFGALVTDIFDSSPAEKAGLKRGDVILEVNGNKIKNVETLRNMVAQSKVGNKIKLKILRDGKELSINATVAEFPQEIALAVPGGKEKNLLEDENALAGFSVMDLTREIAKQLGLSRNEQGVVIVSVDPYTAAEDAGLKKGDVIQEINKKRVKNLSDFSKILPHAREGDTILLFINRGGKKFYITLKIYS